MTNTLEDVYNRRETHVTPDGTLWYHYHAHGVWKCIDQDATCVSVKESDLPRNLITVDVWHKQQQLETSKNYMATLASLYYPYWRHYD